MRDEDKPIDDCADWTEATFFQRFSAVPLPEGATRDGANATLATSRIFELARNGRVADLQRVLTIESEQREQALPRSMPELFSTIALLESSWKARRITFGEAIRGLFTIREVVQNLETGRVPDASAMHFFGAGAIGVMDGEMHDFAPQIVAEKLYVSGWRTEVNVKGGFQWLAERVRLSQLDFVGVSIGSDESLGGLADRIAELRETSRNKSITVIVGGAVFATSNYHFDFLGADCVARKADDAIDHLHARMSSVGATRRH